MEKVTCFSTFSTDGAFLAVADGTQIVTIWDSLSSKQTHRISKPGWSAVQDLAWAPSKVQVGRKRKKRNTLSSVDRGSSLLAVGGNHGVSVWDIKRKEELCAMSSEEFSSILSVTWSSEESLFLADGSPNVAHWNTAENSIERWRCDRKGVRCVSVNSEGSVLVTAGRTIKTWKTSDHSLIRKFSGHVSNVCDLSFITSSIISSTAYNDRNVCLWNTESGDSVSLICESSAYRVASSAHGDKLKIVAVCEDGLHTFSTNVAVVTGSSDPVMPSSTVKIKSKSSSEVLPVLAAALDVSGDVLIAHTSHIRPCFETIPFDQEDSRVCLERVVPKGLLLSDEGKPGPGVKKAPLPVMGSSAPPLPWGQQKKQGEGLEDVPMSERLKALDIKGGQPKEEKQKKVAPTAESLSVLVVQSVHSGDKSMLEEVLQESHERLVNTTVRNLPVTAVVPFLKTLVDLLQTRPSRGPVLSVWIKSLLLQHTAYLLTVPHLLTSLSTLYQSMESRTATYSKLNRLGGKLDLLVSQTSSAAGANGLSNQIQLLNKPLLTISAGEDALVEDDSQEEYDVTLFQSSDEEEGVDEEEEEEDNELEDELSEDEEDMEDD